MPTRGVVSSTRQLVPAERASNYRATPDVAVLIATISAPLALRAIAPDGKTDGLEPGSTLFRNTPPGMNVVMVGVPTAVAFPVTAYELAGNTLSVTLVRTCGLPSNEMAF